MPTVAAAQRKHGGKRLMIRPMTPPPHTVSLPQPPGGVWITGAGTGIGAALARHLGAVGWPVTASGRRAAPLQALASQCPGCVPVPLDVTDRAAVQAAVAAMEPSLPMMAVLCAGTHHPTPGDDFSAAAVQSLIDTNLMGIVHCVEALLPLYRARRSGHLVLVASVAGYRGLPTAAGYCASKAAVIALAESLRLDLADSGVRVTLVNPGFVDTPLTRQNPFPMPDLITAEAAALAIVRGLERGRFEIAFPSRFAAAMKLLRCLPDRWYFAAVRRFTGL